MLESVADSDANVLIVGESGTGKELAANAVHAKSPRRRRALVKINCAALPKDLIESELFGHVKGAFTGATTDKAGLLEEAHRGSLLLDEITEMPIDLQAKLLRVLEDRMVRRLGGAKIVPVDFRLICSTNRESGAGAARRALRQDLYFRINTVTVALPPLRERTRGHPAPGRSLPRALRAKHSARSRRIDPEAYRRLLSLRRGRAMSASCSTRSSGRCWWPAGARSPWPICRSRCSMAREGGLGRERSRRPRSRRLARGDRARLDPAGARDATRWNKQAAAALLGLRRPTLYSKMRKHGIPQRRP